MNQKKRRHIFAVCDVEVDYAYNFMEYLNRKKSLPFEVQAFTGPEVLVRVRPWRIPLRSC